MNKELALKEFGMHLRSIRKNQELSQEKLAEYCQLDRTYISGLERGLRNPSLTCLILLSEGLKIKTSELLDGIKLIENK
jgi:transcriptional regulator with XRE-family HTH domain